MIKNLCWLYHHITPCVHDVYTRLSRRCGPRVSRTLEALRELLLVSARTLIASDFVGEVTFVARWSKYLKMIIPVVLDPLRGDVMNEVCRSFRQM